MLNAAFERPKGLCHPPNPEILESNSNSNLVPFETKFNFVQIGVVRRDTNNTSREHTCHPQRLIRSRQRFRHFRFNSRRSFVNEGNEFFQRRN